MSANKESLWKWIALVAIAIIGWLWFSGPPSGAEEEATPVANEAPSRPQVDVQENPDGFDVRIRIDKDGLAAASQETASRPDAFSELTPVFTGLPAIPPPGAVYSFRPRVVRIAAATPYCEVRQRGAFKRFFGALGKPFGAGRNRTNYEPSVPEQGYQPPGASQWDESQVVFCVGADEEGIVRKTITLSPPSRLEQEAKAALHDLRYASPKRLKDGELAWAEATIYVDVFRQQ